MAVEVRTLASGEAVFLDNTTDWTFGPLLPDVETGEAFLKWLSCDIRLLDSGTQETRWWEFRKAVPDPNLWLELEHEVGAMLHTLQGDALYAYCLDLSHTPAGRSLLPDEMVERWEQEQDTRQYQWEGGGQ